MKDLYIGPIRLPVGLHVGQNKAAIDIDPNLPNLPADRGERREQLLRMLLEVELKVTRPLECRQRSDVHDDRMVVREQNWRVVGDDLRNSIESKIAKAIG
ncbi:hypothetical protein [Bradyrhizobium erythrophlei]|uniref:hypothetical protein n=1 Tax=Bradyrhizobium erythrophlei TaxID=1437360 RepID=UPI0012ABE620|nr:hypothetical protein [Bradyrhizobium erythrophlei]